MLMRVLIVGILVTLLLLLIALWVNFTTRLVLMSRYELKKRAQKGDKIAKKVFSLTAGGREVLVACLIAAVLSVAVITLLLGYVIWSPFAAVLATVLVVIFGILLPFLYGGNSGFVFAAKTVKVSAKILVVLRPIIRPLGQKLDRALGKTSYLYSKDQLLHVIDEHTGSPFTDISAEEARLIRRSLQFGSIRVSDVMVPRKVVDTVSVEDEIVPLMLDELHKSGHSRFPVFDPNNDDAIVGTLYLHDLVGAKKSGSVRDLMSKKVFYVHEELDLNHALNAFLKTRHHLFIVVNNFGEFVGILTIEDVLEQILGREIIDEFDKYENLREVAKLRAQKEQSSSDKNMV